MKRMVALAMMALVVMTAGIATAAMKGSADVVQVAAVSKTVTAAPGERVAFGIKLDVSKTWHVYAHGDTNFIGVDLVPAESMPLTDIQAEYPKGHPGEFFGETVYMISGHEQIAVSGLVPAGLAKGEHELEFGVTVQACDDKTCLAPVDLPVALKLVVK